MKTYLKKISALVLTVILVLSMCTAALADEPSGGASGTTEPTGTTSEGNGTETDKGTITVRGVEDTSTDLKVTAYPIIKAEYNNGGQFSGYASVYPAVIEKSAIEEIAETLSEDDLTSIIAELKNGAGDEKYTMESTDSDRSVYTAKVPVGAYLVLITGAETRIYSPVVASVQYVYNATSNELENGTVNLLGSNTWVKVRNNPDLTKTIDEPDRDQMRDGQNEKHDHGNTVSIGDTVHYTLTTEIPYYSGLYPVFNISDTLNGLNYQDNSLVVKVLGGAAGKPDVTLDGTTDYSFIRNKNENNDGFTVDFVLSGEYTLNQYQGKTLEITYSATVADDALINQDAKTNEATLKYSHDSTQKGKEGEDKDKTYTYTFDIDATVEGSVTEKLLTKVDKDPYETTKENEPLSGAEFTLFKDAECKTPYTNDWVVDSGKTFDGKVVSNADGQLPIKGLKAGTYYLKETKAPQGYALINTVYKIEIKVQLNTDGSLEQWSISVNGDTIEAGNTTGGENHTVTATYPVTLNNGTATSVKSDVEVEIPNTRLSALPSTGGIGTYLFTIIGVVIMAVAAGIFFVKRRRDAE